LGIKKCAAKSALSSLQYKAFRFCTKSILQVVSSQHSSCKFCCILVVKWIQLNVLSKQVELINPLKKRGYIVKTNFRPWKCHFLFNTETELLLIIHILIVSWHLNVQLCRKYFGSWSFFRSIGLDNAYCLKFHIYKTPKLVIFHDNFAVTLNPNFDARTSKLLILNTLDCKSKQEPT
jgi:hypothetical protein